MKEYRLNVMAIIVIMSFISCILLICLLVITTNDIKNAHLFKYLIRFGLISSILGVIWWVLETHLWRFIPFKWLRKYLRIPPDLNGRWEGIINRPNENRPHKFVIEISQKWSALQVYTYTESSSSKSIVDDIICADKTNDNFKISYLWTGNGGKYLENPKSESEFLGYTILKFIKNENVKKMKGIYFTNREPQSKGIIEVEFVSNKLFKEFQS